MDCSELCPYLVTNFNCEVPQLTSEQIKSIFFINRLSENLYIGDMMNHSVLILIANQNVCNLIKFYPYAPKVLGAWLCHDTYNYTIVFENLNYHHIQDFSLLEYEAIFNTVIYLNHRLGVSHNNLNFNNILINDEGKVVFLYFDKSSRYTDQPYDLNNLNRIFSQKLINLPDWKNFYENMISSDSEYPKMSDLKDYFDNLFSIELDLLKSGYVVIRKLGEGAFGQVYEVSNSNGEKYAVKLFRYYLNDNDIMIGDGDLSDINFSQMLKYPYIIESIDFIMLNKYVGIVMEVADSTLEDYMKLKSFGYIQKLRFIYQLASALDYLSTLGYVHCDLKPNNILIKDNNLLLADFSLLRIKENIADVSCQTWNYRAPEQYFEPNITTEYTKIFSREQIEKWKTQQIPAEMWSFGILCLDILYGKSFVTWFGNSQINKSLDSVKREYPEFLNLLSYDYNFRESWETILVRYGKLSPSETEILKVISRMFLDLNQDKRVKSYKELLNSYIFDIINIPELSNFSKIQVSRDMIVNNEVYTPKMLDITTKWMFELAEEFKLAPYIIFNSVDFFLQNAHKYISKKEDIQLFAICSMWINSSLHLNRNKSVDDYVYIADNAYTREQIYNRVIKIIRTEKGKFMIDRIYNYLPTVETLYQARDIMIDCEKYSKLGVLGTSLNLLKPKSFDKVSGSTNKILLKEYRNTL